MIEINSQDIPRFMEVIKRTGEQSLEKWKRILKNKEFERISEPCGFCELAKQLRIKYLIDITHSCHICQIDPIVCNGVDTTEPKGLFEYIEQYADDYTTDPEDPLLLEAISTMVEIMTDYANNGELSIPVLAQCEEMIEKIQEAIIQWEDDKQ